MNTLSILRYYNYFNSHEHFYKTYHKVNYFYFKRYKLEVTFLHGFLSFISFR